MSRPFCEVAVPVPIHDTFTYKVPPEWQEQIALGCRVAVPFGARKLVGVVTALPDAPRTKHKLKSLIEVLDSEAAPALTADLLRLSRWVGEYYAAPIGEVVRSMLPLHGEFTLSEKASLTVAGTERLAYLKAEEKLSARDESEYELLSSFTRRKERVLSGLVRSLDDGARRIAAARKAGWLELDRSVRRRRSRDAASGSSELLTSEWVGNAELQLNPEQQAALDQVCQGIASGKFSTLLLHGVTGSGKTEVYARAIEHCLEAGKSAILLVPEIALTPAVAEQFAARFSGKVAVLHSGMTQKERSAEWWRIRRGEATVAIGTRSAVFAPVSNLGLIIVDEEQDSSYKQGESPRYHGRDVAVVRAKSAHAVAVLGSATPALETFHQARAGRYQMLAMSKRVAGRDMATVEVLDMREEFKRSGKTGLLAETLVEGMQRALADGGQVLVLRNRRGYANFMICRRCGVAARCRDCSISLTYHRRRARLICHYCGYNRPVPEKCEECGGKHLHFVGEGTEKVEEAVREALPGAKIDRLDRDTAIGRKQGDSVLRRFVRGELDVLVGTQMIAKGHDFQGVSLVGVVSADAMLALPDFRAAERTFQLITQVAGRAGRGELPGRVLVQSYFPDHYAVEQAAAQDYEGFFEKELHFRRMMHYPPFVALANVIVRDKRLEVALHYSRILQNYFESRRSDRLRILGPATAPIARLKQEYRFQFLLKSSGRKALQEILRGAAECAAEKRIPPTAVVADVDPLHLL